MRSGNMADQEIGYGYMPPGEDHEAPVSYGSVSKRFSAKGVVKVDLPQIIRTFFLPFLIFAVVYVVRSTSIRYSNPALADVLCGVLVLYVLLISAHATMVSKESFHNAKMGIFLCVACAYAWTAGFFLGDCNFKLNVQPYYDLMSLNIYDNVDPDRFRGQQLMDAGQIAFTVGSHLDLSLAYGFRDKDVYCVVPIVGPSGSGAHGANHTTKSGAPRYDFWAVGVNCCDAHQALFKCGEYSNPRAQKGLRLLRDDERAYFRLAVQSAEASYDIHAPSPVFMHWMENPQDEVNAYQDDGVKYLIMGLFVFFAAHLCLTLFMYGSEKVLSALWNLLPRL